MARPRELVLQLEGDRVDLEPAEPVEVAAQRLQPVLVVLGVPVDDAQRVARPVGDRPPRQHAAGAAVAVEQQQQRLHAVEQPRRGIAGHADTVRTDLEAVRLPVYRGLGAGPDRARPDRERDRARRDPGRAGLDRPLPAVLLCHTRHQRGHGRVVLGDPVQRHLPRGVDRQRGVGQFHLARRRDHGISAQAQRGDEGGGRFAGIRHDWASFAVMIPHAGGGGKAGMPGREHMLRIAAQAGIAGRDATEIVQAVAVVAADWPRFARDAGLGDRPIREVGNVIRACLKLT
jgi:hypothetical protein